MNLLYDEETNRVNALYGHFVGHIVYTIVVIYELICCSIAACCLFSVCVCARFTLDVSIYALFSSLSHDFIDSNSRFLFGQYQPT